MAKPTPPEFMKWLDGQLADRDWSDNQLAKKAGLNSSTISRIRSGTAPGHRACDAIAAALGLEDSEIVLRLAGWLGKEPDYDPGMEELSYTYRQAAPEDKERILRLARELVQVANEQRQRGRKK